MSKLNLNMKLQSVSKVFNEENVEDNSLIKATFLILELDTLSGNNEIITKEEGLKMASSMQLKPLLCQYTPTDNYVIPNDHFGSHGVYKEKFREGGQEFIATNSIAIGVAKDGCYLGAVENQDGSTTECLYADYYLWLDKYPNVIGLIESIVENGGDLYSSCEYRYSKYILNEETKIKYPLDLTFVGHCILCSGENNSIPVNPAFKKSKLVSFNEQLNEAVNEIIFNSIKGDEEMADKKDNIIVENNDETIVNNDNSEVVVENPEEQVNNEENVIVEGEETVVVNELSQEDVRQTLRKLVAEKLGVEKYDVWISSELVYDSYFIFEYWNNTEEEYQFFKATFTRQGDVITIGDEFTKVERKTVWITTEEAQTTLNEKEEIIKTLNSEKEAIQVKFNEVSEQVITLNSENGALKDKASKYDEFVFNEAVDKAKVFYEEKFIGLNAKAKFESEEVQTLIVNSVNDINAKTKLNEMVIDLVPKAKIVTEAKKTVNETVVKVENLLTEKPKSFEERYGF